MVSTQAKDAIIVVDVQNDFVDGSLGTDRGLEVARGINAWLGGLVHAEGEEAEASDGSSVASRPLIVGTKDWHIKPEGHFAPEGEEPDYKDTWPVHCVADTHGAQVCAELNPELVDVWFHKGEYTAAYSGFEGHLAGEEQTLQQWLNSHEVENVTIVGIATDFCVRATALDAMNAGLHVRVIEQLCSAVTEQGGKSAIQELEDAGAEIIRD
ncbi:isochorismatase family protein [Corynebacterium jeikeium]|uniref:isochorismatase family protein n=1 Tax=Corynebacterium jeikeium TaxID=38289 RepID=UPI0001B71B05|nr:isochorismatase family protein [Corynebacterium jeikeium]EEW17329.1 isochorismatase family protein [Corynebacterium jeikeium ATCC 43734]OOD30809.1 nicotinamidase [Corynebacterium jeikeium]WCZ54076.1 nicotinamidase/pyrazinamidase [Corynebacterium jeikeium]SQI20393.1 pyrazinamidase / nicotinamidase [Corynebacterium jeikeium]SUY80618.1 pyrazinamidase / nicotinamidase [Corynebacterium jeikeium]